MDENQEISVDERNCNLSMNSRSKKICETIKTKKYNKPKVPKFFRKRKVKGKIVNQGFTLKHQSDMSLSIDFDYYYRIMDFIFCSSFFDDDQAKKNLALMGKGFRPFFLQINFKRIVRITHEFNSNLWYFCLEERFSNESFHLDLTNSTRIFNRLFQSDNYKCKNIALLLEKHIETVHLIKLNLIETGSSVDNETPIIIKNAANLDFLRNLEIKMEGEKAWFVKLDEKIQHEISKLPFIIFQKDYYIQNKADTTTGFYLNNIMLEQLNFKDINLGHNYEGFEVLESLYCDDWASLYEKLLLFLTSWSEKELNQTNQELYMYKENVYEKKGVFIVYKQCYYEPSSGFIVELLFVFIDEI